MSLEKIKLKILEEAKEEASGIIKEAKERVETAKEEAKRAAEERFKKEIENEKAGTALEEERYLLESKAKINAEALCLKNQFIDEVFNRAIDRIAKLNESDYLLFIVKYFSLNLSSGIDTLIISQDDKNIITSEWVHSLLKKMDKHIRLKIITSQGIRKGFILKGDKVEINCSLEQIVEDKKEELKLRIYRGLF